MTTKIYEPGFEPIGHLYSDDNGMLLDGVTSSISIALGLPTGKWLLPYAERGTNVDLTCQMYDENDLDESSVCEGIKPYFEQYKLSLAHYKIKVVQNKIRRYLPKYGVAGELDKIALIGDSIWVIDLKTTKEQHKHHKFQTAPYLKMVEEELSEKYPGMIQKRGCLYIRPDSFELVEHTGQDDFGEFLILRESAKIKIRDGYSTKRKQCEWDF
jgi:hypothetical protein